MKKSILMLTLISCFANAGLTPGLTEPFDTIKVTSEIEGTIVSYDKEIGEVVGDMPLVKIDDERIRLLRDFAKEELVQINTEKNYYTKRLARYENLLKQKNLSESDFEDVLYQLDVAKNKIRQQEITVKQKEDDLSNTKIFGEVGYVVSKRNVDVGEYVNSATELYELIDIRKLKVSVMASEKILSAFEVGNKINVIIDEENHEGIVKYKGVSVLDDTYAYPVIIEINNPENKIPVAKTVFVEYGDI